MKGGTDSLGNVFCARAPQHVTWILSRRQTRAGKDIPEAISMRPGKKRKR